MSDDGDREAVPTYEYPEYEYDTFVLQNELMASEAITPILDVTNPGSVIGGGSLSRYVDGEEVNETFVRVPVGEAAQIDFALKPDEPGTYEVAVGTASDEIVDAETVEIAPKSDEFEQLSFDGFAVPDTVERARPIEVSGTVSNTDDAETLQVMAMTVDDEVVRVRRIDLEAGASSDVTFEAPGEYAVEIEDLGPWTVTVPEPGASDG